MEKKFRPDSILCKRSIARSWTISLDLSLIIIDRVILDDFSIKTFVYLIINCDY